MADVIGTVGLVVRPITKNFAQETKAKVNESLKGTKVDAPETDFSKTEKAAGNAKKKITKDFDDTSRDSNKSIDSIGSKKGLFRNLLDSVSEATKNIKNNFTKTTKEADDAVRKIGSGGIGDGGKGKKATGGLSDEFSKLTKAAIGLKAGLALLKISAVVEGITAAIPAVVALSGVVVAFTGALSYLGGVAGALPSLLGALGQGLGVVKLASGGIGDALKAAAEGGAKFDEAMKDLTPAARTFVKEILSMKDQFKALRDIASSNLFPGVTAGLKSIRPLLYDLRPVIAGTARVMGDLAKEAGAMVGSPAFRSDLVAFGKGNITVLRNLGGAGLNFIKVLKDIALVAQPLAILISTLTNRFSENLASTVAASRESGKLADFFEKTKSTLLDTVSIVGDLFGTLRSLFRAGFPEGARYLFDLRSAFANMRDITEKAEQSGSLQKFFEGVRPAAEALGGIFKDLLKGLVDIGIKTGPALVPVLNKIRDELVPAVLKLLSTLDTDFLNALVGMVTQAVRFVDTFLTASVALKTALVVVEGIFKFVNFLGNELGFVSKILVNVVASFLTIKTLLLGYRVTKLITDFINWEGAIKKAKDAMIALRANVALLGGTARAALLATGIGALIVLLGVLAAKFISVQGAAKAAFKDDLAARATNDMKSYDDAVAGITETVTKAKKAHAEFDGVVGTARGTFFAFTDTLGLTNRKVLENEKISQDGAAAIKKAAEESQHLKNVTEALGKTYGIATGDVTALADKYKIDLFQGVDAVGGKFDEAYKKTRDSIIPTQDLSKEIGILGDQSSTAADKLDAFKNALDKTLNLTLSLFDAQTALVKSEQALEVAYKAAGGAANIHSKEGQELRDTFSSLVKAQSDLIQKEIEAAATSSDAGAAINRYREFLNKLGKDMPGLAGPVNELITSLNKTGIASKQVTDLTNGFKDQIGQLGAKFPNLQTELSTFSTNLDIAKSKGLSAGDATEQYRRFLTDLQNKVPGVRGELQQLIDGLGKAGTTASDAARLTDTYKAQISELRDRFPGARGELQGLIGQLESAKGSTGNTAAATAQYREQLLQLQNKVPALRGEIQTLIERLDNVPRNTNANVNVNTGNAAANLREIVGLMNTVAAKDAIANPSNYVRTADGGFAYAGAMAKGGIFDQATMGVFGEAGKEVILPLTDAKRTLELAQQSGLFEVLAQAQSAAPAAGGTPPSSGRVSGGGGGGVVFGPGSVIVQMTGSGVSSDEARTVGQQVGLGIKDVMASQEASTEARVI